MANAPVLNRQNLGKPVAAYIPRYMTIDDYNTPSLDWPFDIKAGPAINTQIRTYIKATSLILDGQEVAATTGGSLLSRGTYRRLSPTLLRSTPEFFAVILVPLPPSFLP